MMGQVRWVDRVLAAGQHEHGQRQSLATREVGAGAVEGDAFQARQACAGLGRIELAKQGRCYIGRLIEDLPP